MKNGEPFCGIETYVCETVVVGSGAAGYNAADTLYRKGNSEFVVLSDDLSFGTSRNTGSDKQTYYKLSLCGSDPDSVRAMAEDLYAGGAVDGDLALAEAANSTSSFLKLASLGVPFPMNHYGEFVGYKTDHDPRQRATSAGPYTSRFMTEVLEESLKKQGATLLGGLLVVKILVEEGEVRGVLCLRKKEADFCIFWCRNLVWATGGPAVMYANSAYPATQFGSSGLAFEAGCMAQNLTEWQYGMASLTPRWNVSGTYMQALPRFYSVDSEGKERDFLSEQFEDPSLMLSLIFLKGYQWPFDVRKIREGSSIIDLLVYQELEQGRRVYLDFRQNPVEEEIDFTKLQEEAYTYLHRGNADFGLPIDRLKQMNTPAYDFYREHGVDLAIKPLEISLCAQHNNGGLAVNAWWQTSIDGIFAVGEVAATHGVYRPGGSALNAGQVGSARAATYINAKRHSPDWTPSFCDKEQITAVLSIAQNAVGTEDTASVVYHNVRKKMSLYASLIREESRILTLKNEVLEHLKNFSSLRVSSSSRLPFLFRLHDCLLSQLSYLGAMQEYVQAGGRSRGSALYLVEKGDLLHSLCPPTFRAVLEDFENKPKIQQLTLQKFTTTITWRDCHPIPEENNHFETVWKAYREHGNI